MARESLKTITRSALRTIGKPICKRLCGRTDPIDDLRRLAQLIKPGAILDIGAHVGKVAKSLAKNIPGAPIHAFEPTPGSAAALRTAVYNFPQISVHEMAISSHTGERTFFLNNNEQTNSLLDNGEANSRFFGSATAHHAFVTVQTITLDAWMGRHAPPTPLFIKADIQGAEMDLIEGGRETLRNGTAIFFSEAPLVPLYRNAGDLFQIHHEITSSLPFVLLDIYRTYRNGSGRAMWTDAMWIHKDFLSLIGE